MSNPPSNERHAVADQFGAIERVGAGLVRQVRVFAFWTAVVLPFLYVPLLLTGLSTTGEAIAFLVLLGANAVTLLLGHPHHRD